MSKIKFYFIVLIATLAIVSCSKSSSDDEVVTPPRDYGTQYTADKAMIEEYLQKNYIEVVDKPGSTNDQDVTIGKLDALHPVSIKDQKKYVLKYRIVKLHGIEYTLYYLILREGKGESPTNVDGVLAAYKGSYLSSLAEASSVVTTATFFEEAKFPNGITDLYRTVRGWKEIFPQLKTGTNKPNADGTVSYNDFGAAVLFIPSGLGYFSVAKNSIPAYSPLVFNVKLYAVERLDHEYYYANGSSGVETIYVPDGVKSFQEDKDGDGYMWEKSELQNGVTDNPDDTDKDGIPDFLDRDDDGDGYATQGEVKDANGKIYAYGALIDDPLTSIDERIGIPRKYTGPLVNPDLPESDSNPRKSQPSDFTDSSRLRRHLDPNCHDMNK
jgi:hypothetical protein